MRIAYLQEYWQLKKHITFDGKIQTAQVLSIPSNVEGSWFVCINV